MNHTKTGRLTKHQIAMHINALLVYQSMVDRRQSSGQATKARQAMEWYDSVADALIATGIAVNKYNVDRV